MSEKPKKQKDESEEDYHKRLEKWYDKIGNVIYLVKVEHTFNAYKELSEAVKGWDNLAKFVVEKGEIMKLRFNEEADDNWLIQAVPLEEIAVKMLELRK